MDLGLRGRKGIVEASSRGLGRACAESLASEGVDLVINGRNEADLLAAAQDLGTRHGVEVVPVAGDVASGDTRLALLQRCPEPDLLILNAGGPPPGSVRQLAAGQWLAAFDRNMLAHIEMVRSVIDGMCERGFGRIIVVSSAMVTTPRPTMALSSGVRAGLWAALKGLSFDVARYNVTINSLLPERFDTQRQIDMARTAMTRDGLSWDDARSAQVQSIAAKRLGDPREFGAACAFLCSELAGYTSGQVLHLDGGSYPGLV